MDAAARPRALFVYYTFTKQALRVTEDMEAVFHERGWDTERAEIEFTDSRYVKNFARFPMRHRYFDVVRMLPAQLRRGDRHLGVKIPPTNIQPDGDDAARTFASQLTDRLAIKN